MSKLSRDKGARGERTGGLAQRGQEYFIQEDVPEAWMQTERSAIEGNWCCFLRRFLCHEATHRRY